MPLHLPLNVNQNGWHADSEDTATVSSCLANIQKYPFEPSMKPDRLGRVCDFTFATYQKNLREGGRFIPPGFEEEMEFQTVDTRPLQRQPRNQWTRSRMHVKHSTAAYQEKNKQEEELMLGKKLKSEQKKQIAAMQARYARMNARQRTFAEWSVQPTPDWTVELEIPLGQLPKQMIDASKIQVQDLFWRGELRLYNKQADKITPKAPVPLQPLSDELDYYWVSTQDDNCIKDLLLDENREVHVAATDQVLSCLMAAPQSRYSWHLNITKLENKLIIDKEDNSIVDLLTVNETAPEPPMQDAENKLNRPAALGCEAVKINQNIRQQVLVSGQQTESFERPPFVEEGDSPAAVAYRYRLFTLPARQHAPSEFGKKPINLVTRGEVNARLPGGGYMAVFALNEYDVKSQRSWRSQIENQKGALLATEIRNNMCKLRKLVASAMIAGCEHLRLGFVSRKSPNDNDRHSILSVQSYNTAELGLQIGLKPDNAWGIVRTLVDMIMDKPDGRFVLLKDPMKYIMRLYAVPDSEDDEDEDVLDAVAASAAAAARKAKRAPSSATAGA